MKKTLTLGHLTICRAAYLHYIRPLEYQLSSSSGEFIFDIHPKKEREKTYISPDWRLISLQIGG